MMPQSPKDQSFATVDGLTEPTSISSWRAYRSWQFLEKAHTESNPVNIKYLWFKLTWTGIRMDSVDGKPIGSHWCLLVLVQTTLVKGGAPGFQDIQHELLWKKQPATLHNLPCKIRMFTWINTNKIKLRIKTTTWSLKPPWSFEWFWEWPAPQPQMLRPPPSHWSCCFRVPPSASSSTPSTHGGWSSNSS